MRKIRIENWKAKLPNGKEGEENLLIALSVLIANKRPEEMPRGLDKFRLFNRLSKAFDKAEKSRELVLEEMDYTFLKDLIEKEVPSIWGMNPNLSKAVEDFLNTKQEG